MRPSSTLTITHRLNHRESTVYPTTMKFLVCTVLLAAVACASREKRGIFGEPGGLLTPSVHSAPLLSSHSLHAPLHSHSISAPLLSSHSLHSAPVLSSHSLHSAPLLSSHALHSAPLLSSHSLHSAPLISAPSYHAPAIRYAAAPAISYSAAPAISYSAPAISYSAPLVSSHHAHHAPLLAAHPHPAVTIIKTPVVHHTKYVAAPRYATGW